MKKEVVTVAALLLLLFFTASASAQRGRKGMGGPPSLPSECASIAGLKLGDEQMTAMERIEKDYSGRIESLRRELMTKRLELQSLFKNPQSDVQAIRAKAREVIDLQGACQQLTVDYQIEVRGLLTQEQRGKWCVPTDSCLPKGWMRWSCPGS